MSVMSGCTDKEHKDRAWSHPFCFLCGKRIRTVEMKRFQLSCEKCGKPIHVSWKYCGWCGAGLKNPLAQPVPQNSPVSTVSSMETRERSK